MKRRASIRPARFSHRAAERKSNRILACRALFGASGSVQLVEELPGPVEEGAELIRIGHEIDNERDRGQHEDCVSHGDYPAQTC